MDIYWFWHGPAGLYWSNWEGRYRVLGCTCWIFFFFFFMLYLWSCLQISGNRARQTAGQVSYHSSCNTNQRKISICGYLPFISVSFPHRANSNQKLYWFFFCVCVFVAIWSSLFITSSFSVPTVLLFTLFCTCLMSMNNYASHPSSSICLVKS